MPKLAAMAQSSSRSTSPRSGSAADVWNGRRVGITGAGGELGRALTRCLRERGAHVIALSHRSEPSERDLNAGPNDWVRWSCGREDALDSTLQDLDLLVLNHGINPGGDQCPESLSLAIEVNAMSHWRLLQRFERLHSTEATGSKPAEVWVNTSEAEIQPALSPAYELSKRLIGQLVSLRWSAPARERAGLPKLRKLVLGPFRSKLNPIGVMSADFVAKQIVWQAEFGLPLIIITPNPITWVVMPLTEFGRLLYYRIFRVSHPDP
ncbi:C-terminal Rossman-fold domain of the monoglucosyldiacylglycerol epimerase MgdE [Synechococcus sp. A18-25c]|uniref:SDR family oxidoreductase n=1 Tax=unclassified Synechococcus TaxID=2626047 RepID=UPI000C5C745C|nr:MULTISPECIES: SDR family oxidoreductase [unclassified Synechococcus]MAN18277.1 short-chain dehydrogenase [Synechococcus sp. EAC657]MEC7247790.1 SDR family oxidoreductase [Cyanobacteriota bacterium]MEC7896768.1 SDR family oxidoreductase [Cyanobacteriota bacterium]QNJ19356.1 C-terminal Rossman-fold domain of the monoglucosyldiacylglycerol epimerase MgdE [Synechococcus sp. A18-25c]